MAESLAGRKIVLGITGSIAAYKAAELTSLLTKAGADVWPVMTHAATRFITPLTIATLARHPVADDFWNEDKGWQPGHIELADKADLLLIAPATADCLARMSQGRADDLLSAIYLATRSPVLVAPAMNGNMYAHAATQANLGVLSARGVHFIGPEEGIQACGYSGLGRLIQPALILEKVHHLLVGDVLPCG